MGKIQHFRNGMTVFIGALVATVGFSGGVAAQTVYKSVDDAGHVAYTDRPPLQLDGGGQSLEVTEVEIQRSDRELVAANRAAAEDNERVKEAVDGIRAGHDAEDAALLARKEEHRRSNCKLARERLTKYSQARRLYRQDEAGERVFLSDQEIDSARAEAVRAVDEWCG